MGPLICDKRTTALAELMRPSLRRASRPLRLLVVGCGDGAEARDLAVLLQCKVDAIDVTDQFSHPHPDVTFHCMDAEKMTFPDGAFDAAYSFHAVEHIPHPERAMEEIRRVLCDGGVFCVGTPNRLRLLCYFGSRNTRLSEKIAWNLSDWRMRLRGRFRNEYGAHAGFSLNELIGLCGRIGRADVISEAYYMKVHARYLHLVRMITILRVSGVLFPCHYVMGRKEADL